MRAALSVAFLFAVADRFGMWLAEVSVWGSWKPFVAYIASINPWLPKGLVPSIAIAVTVMELLLIIGFKTEYAAKASGVLLLIFAFAMTVSTGVKGGLGLFGLHRLGSCFCVGRYEGQMFRGGCTALPKNRMTPKSGRVLHSL